MFVFVLEVKGLLGFDFWMFISFFTGVKSVLYVNVNFIFVNLSYFRFKSV